VFKAADLNVTSTGGDVVVFVFFKSTSKAMNMKLVYQHIVILLILMLVVYLVLYICYLVTTTL